MADPQSSRILSPSREAEFFRCLDTIEEEVRRLPQNLCVLLTHTPLTQDGSRYSLFEGQGHELGTHWSSDGDLPDYRLVGQPPEMFPFGTDRFPYGVVLSRSSVLLDIATVPAGGTWLNFGGKCGFYVAGNAVRDSLPEGEVAHALTERTIWHYFVENIGESIPDEVTFASVNEQLMQCYHGIRETLRPFESELALVASDNFPLVNSELDWPEMLLYLGLKHPGPFFGVDQDSIIRSLQGENLVPWGRPDECHHVFRMRPPSVARATLCALGVLRRLVHFVGEPVVGNSPVIEAATTIPLPPSPDRAVAQVNTVTPAPSGDEPGANKGEDKAFDSPLSRLLSVYTDGLSDDRIRQAGKVLEDTKMSTNEKLAEIDRLMPFPPTASASQLGQLLGVTKQAVLKTTWWKQKRRGKTANEFGRRQSIHEQRASQLGPAGPGDEGE